MSSSSLILGGGIAGENTPFIKKTFMNHVFSTSEDSKAEIMNILQYAGLAIIPVIALNKIIQRFIPDADPDKSNIEIGFEIALQIILLFCGMILIHRIITFLPAYSGFPYSPFMLTNSTLTFLIIILSIQTKMGIKVNILVDRLMDLWNGGTGQVLYEKKSGNGGGGSRHRPSQADHLDNSQMQNELFPPAPVATTKGVVQRMEQQEIEPVAANSLIGSFGGRF